MTADIRADPYRLERFLDAQEGVIERVLVELRQGRKRSHWMWFIFPQIRGLGSSPMAIEFAISCRQEASAYLAHPILGSRLRQCTELVNRIEGASIAEIFGYPDELKFRSSMTLFANSTPDNKPFEDALKKYFEGEPDPRTLERL